MITIKEANERLARYLKFYHNKTLDDVEISNCKGYWDIKKIYNGECRMGHTHPMNHTIRFGEGGRDERGRFKKGCETWYVLKNAIDDINNKEEDGVKWLK